MVYRALGVWENESGLWFAFTEFHENAGQWTYQIEQTGLKQAGVLSKQVNGFIEENNLKYQVALITIHTNTSFNAGATVAADTQLPVISGLQALDFALGGNGEFISGAAEKLGMNLSEMNETDSAVCVAFMGILRWREEYNFLSSVTGASRNTIGGAIWLGQEA
jgi:hypothetical protein